MNTGSFSRDLLHGMSVGVFASALRETVVETEGQLVPAVLPFAILDFVHPGLTFTFQHGSL